MTEVERPGALEAVEIPSAGQATVLERGTSEDRPRSEAPTQGEQCCDPNCGPGICG